MKERQAELFSLGRLNGFGTMEPQTSRNELRTVKGTS